jgi:hypothetical protein
MGTVEATSHASEISDERRPIDSQACRLDPETEPMYSVRVLTSMHEIEALRSTWVKWSHTFDSDIDYFLFNLTHDSSILRPYVITLYAGDFPRAILVGQIKKRKSSEPVSFVNLAAPEGRVLNSKQRLSLALQRHTRQS